MKQELLTLLSLKHANIVRVLDLCEDDMFIYIVSELIPNGDMFSVVTDLVNNKEPFTESDVVALVTQLLSALNYLHANRVTHRNLKLENILLCKSGEDNKLVCKLTDFGYVRYIEDTETSLIIGNPLYMAPEVINGDTFDEKIDIWALGIITCQLLTGYHPFVANDKVSLFAKVLSDKPKLKGGKK